MIRYSRKINGNFEQNRVGSVWSKQKIGILHRLVSDIQQENLIFMGIQQGTSQTVDCLVLCACFKRYSCVRKTFQVPKLLPYLYNYHIKNILHIFRVIVVEQTGDALFNRGKLLNIGYIEALKIDNKIDCFIFHDVDLLPQNSLNIYACTHQPRHMYSAIDIFRYHLPYSRLFGGAVAMQSIHFNAINGFSNSFFGWGGEDDDFYNRLEKNGLEIVRFHPNIASYIALPHTKAKPAPDRYKQIYQGQSNGNKEGLLDISYKVKRVKTNALFTWILATC
ncbi:unnamed protein product, partial [Meganyctiphanes norvegica]